MLQTKPSVCEDYTKWLFPPRFSAKQITSSRPDPVLVAPVISAKTKQQATD